MLKLSIHNHHTELDHVDEVDLTLYHIISRPLVSTGKRIQATAAKPNTSSKTTTASIWWQLCSMPTAIRGQTMPPILPMAVAIPTPVERADVGYTW
jgi:hypothetical protein